jgi:O-antigen/teichoic acid export membrane protein
VLTMSAVGRGILLARILAPAPLGRVFLMLSASAVACAVGQTGLAMVGLSRVAGAGDGEGAAHHVRSVIDVTAAVNAVLLVIAVSLLTMFGLPARQVASFALLMSTLVWLGLLAALVRGRQQVTKAIRFEQIVAPALQLLTLAAYAAVAADATVEGAVTVVALAAIPSIAGLGWSLREALAMRSARAPRLRRSLVKEAIPVVATALVWRGLADAPLWAAGVVLGEASSGVFAVGQRLAAVLSLPLAAVGTVLAPRVAALFARHELGVLQETLQDGARAAAAVTAVGLLALLVVGRPLVSAIYGPLFVAALPVALILGFAQLINSAAGIGGFMLITMNQASTLLRISLATIVVLFALMLPFGLLFGLAGLAGTALIAVTIQNVAMIRAVHRSSGLRVYATWR